MNILGMWHRPFEKNTQEVNQTLKELKSMGITDIFLETFFNGKSIFPCKKSIFDVHDFVIDYDIYGKNLLTCFIEEGRKYNIKVHAWVENFFIGVYKNKRSIQLYHKYPQYFLKTFENDIFQKEETNYVFLDPINPLVQKHILKIYEQISQEDIASLHLDYIRYPLSYHQTILDLEGDSGYTDYALKVFSNQMHIDQSFIKERILTDEKVLNAWKKFKIETINQWVKKVKHIMRDKKISTAVFGDIKHAINYKMQDWESWINSKWIDILIPMAYYKDASKIASEIREIKKYNIKMITGLAPLYMGQNLDEEFHSVKVSLTENNEGIVLFASQKYLDNSFTGIQDNKHIRDSWSQFLESRRQHV